MAIKVGDRIKLTYREYALLPDDGHTHELIDGRHYMSPSPSAYHQRISRRIQVQLYQQLEISGRGEVFNAPFDVQLSQFDVVQPDLAVFLSEHVGRISPSRALGPPDLAVEILSPSTAAKDRDLKLELYRQAGVPEYWIVDPEAHQVTVYHLHGGTPDERGVFTDRVAMSQPGGRRRRPDSGLVTGLLLSCCCRVLSDVCLHYLGGPSILARVKGNDMVHPTTRLPRAANCPSQPRDGRVRGAVLTAVPSIRRAAAAIGPHIHRSTASASHPHLPHPPATPAGVAGSKRTNGSPHGDPRGGTSMVSSGDHG